MTWIFYASLAVVGAVFIIILQKILMKDEKSDPFANSVAIQILGGIVCLVFAVLSGGFQMPPIAKYPLNFVLTALFYGFAALFSFKSLKTGLWRPRFLCFSR